MDDDFTTAAADWVAILEDSTTALYATEQGVMLGIKVRVGGRKTFTPRIIMTPDLLVHAVR